MTVANLIPPAPVTQAEAGTHLPSSYNFPYMFTEQAKLWVNFGYGHVASEFDDDGTRHDYGTIFLPENVSDPNTSVTWKVLNVGGAYTFYHIRDMNLNAGINFAIAEWRLRRDELFVEGFPIAPAINETSGFSPQNLTVFGEIEMPSYSIRMAYIHDLGHEPEPNADLGNSDRHNALQFGASARAWSGPVRMYGGGDYFLRLPEDEDGISDTSINPGDIIQLHAGVGYNLGRLEAGVAFHYQINRESNPSSPLPISGLSDGFLLSAVPYLTYEPSPGSLQISVKGAVQREYSDYGIALAGRNELSTRRGVTVGLLYGL